MNVTIKINQHWENKTPKVTVVTPVYNRREIIGRTLASVEKQTYRDIEYIIVNDGSTENIDDIIEQFMGQTDLPVMYIKKSNGGVHTARNCGTRMARGEYLCFLDSDDELLPTAIEVFTTTWASIPNEQKHLYHEVVARCIDQNGQQTSPVFPDRVNDSPWAEVRHLRRITDFSTCRPTRIMKENLWQEPEGITFVQEGFLWRKLEQKYRSYFVNDITLCIHKDTVSYSRPRHQTLQTAINQQWNLCYRLNQEEFNDYGIRMRFLWFLQYCKFGQVLRIHGKKDVATLDNLFLRGLRHMIALPAYFAARRYIRKKMH